MILIFFVINLILNGSISFDFLTKEILNIKHNNREKIKIKVNQNTNENSCC